MFFCFVSGVARPPGQGGVGTNTGEYCALAHIHMTIGGAGSGQTWTYVLRKSTHTKSHDTSSLSHQHHAPETKGKRMRYCEGVPSACSTYCCSTVRVAFRVHFVVGFVVRTAAYSKHLGGWHRITSLLSRRLRLLRQTFQMLICCLQQKTIHRLPSKV